MVSINHAMRMVKRPIWTDLFSSCIDGEEGV